MLWSLWLLSQKHFSLMFWNQGNIALFWAFQILHREKEVTQNSIFNLTGDYKNIWCSLTVVTAIYYIKNKLILILVKLKKHCIMLTLGIHLHNWLSAGCVLCDTLIWLLLIFFWISKAASNITCILIFHSHQAIFYVDKLQQMLPFHYWTHYQSLVPELLRKF